MSKNFTSKDSVINNVSVEHPHLGIVDNLNTKLLELRAKRDACALHHEELKYNSDNYNKIIIVLSLMCAFIETIKIQFDFNTIGSSIIGNIASLVPIFISTIVSIISSLLKFKKFPEKMENLIQVIGKANFAIEKIRKLQEFIHFNEDSIVFDLYQKEVADTYREALMNIESAIYPDKRAKYYRIAQQNFVKIKKDETRYLSQISKINRDIVSPFSDSVTSLSSPPAPSSPPASSPASSPVLKRPNT